MFSASRSALLVIGLFCVATAALARELRVCADPDNLPLSRDDGSGFENRIARLVAGEMDAELRYEWLPLRRGFVRKTMGAGSCDVFIGVPKKFDGVLTTRAYYRSSYVFVNGAGARGIDSFDDARLARLRIGVQLVGDDLAATPAGHALAMTSTRFSPSTRFPAPTCHTRSDRETGACNVDRCGVRPHGNRLRTRSAAIRQVASRFGPARGGRRGVRFAGGTAGPRHARGCR